MSGPVALHGGAEFQSGDEPFLAALLDAAAAGGRRRPSDPGGRRADRGRSRPARTSRRRHGVAAFERVAARAGDRCRGRPRSACVNHATASDPELAAWLAAADVIHFPGGDPDLIPTVMPGTAAWAAITDAHVGGAVLAGASAGAMAFASWTWTPGGGMAGLMVVRGLVVVPHARPGDLDADDRALRGLGAARARRARAVREDRRHRGAGRPPGARRSAGASSAPARRAGCPSPTARRSSARSGEVIETPVIPV